MSEPDRPTPIEQDQQQGQHWPVPDDPDATRVVRRDSLPAADEAQESGSTAHAVDPDDDAADLAEPSAEPPSAMAASPSDSSTPQPHRVDAPAPWSERHPEAPAGRPAPWHGSAPDSGSGDAATSYIGAPTALYPGPSSGLPSGSQGGYSYQQDQAYASQSTAAIASGPQFIPPSPTANVVLPPVRMPKAESRVALNILGSIVGLILVFGGLTLVVLYQGKMRTVGAADLGSATSGDVVRALAGTIDVLSLVLTIVGIVLIALAALLAAWASWAAILPGFLLAAASVWAMVTTGADSGAVLIARGTSWAFKDGQFAYFCLSGGGLLVGLLLLLSGLAAVFLRAGVRRTIRQQLDSIQS